MTETFEILNAREHCRLRMNMYLGSSSKETISRFVKGNMVEIQYVPAILKMIDEIIDNSIDEAIRTDFAHANVISVSIKDDVVTVEDNGRGIPHDEILDNVSGEKILRPVAAWTRVNAGSNFDDSSRSGIGMNGVGSAVTGFVSKTFTGETWRDGNLIVVETLDGSAEIKVKHKNRNGAGTKVSFSPDFELFEETSLDDGPYAELVEDRLINLQLCFPDITFKFNGKKIQVSTIKKYAELLPGVSVIHQGKDVSFIVSSSNDSGFLQNSFINGIHTRLGGSYVEFIINGLTDELVPLIKRKHKLEISKAAIKNSLTFILFVKNLRGVKFDSQTKERLTNTNGEVKAHYENDSGADFKKIAQKILNTPDIIDPIIEALLAKKLAAERRAATLAQKKLKKVKVAKHIEAKGEGNTLILSEGDSAAGTLLQIRNPAIHGSFPLRGVVKNTWGEKASDVLKNKELSEICAILNINMTDPDSWVDRTYETVRIMTDADEDGKKISTLLIAFFANFWPGMVEACKVGIVRSPVLISTKGKETKWIYKLSDAIVFKEENPGWYHRYIKGLGSLTPDEYSEIVNNPIIDWVRYEDSDKTLMEMMFGGDADARKEFMIENGGRW